MKVLVTGSGGFIGKNLVARLQCEDEITVLPCDVDCPEAAFNSALQSCDALIHLAGVNRPDHHSAFMEVNRDFTVELLQKLVRYGNTCPILAASSIQAVEDNPYGRSKKAMEDTLFSYAQSTGTRVTVYRLPNVFGKWCRPHYNSVVATFCHQIARDEEIRIDNPYHAIRLAYIDDVVEEFVGALRNPAAVSTDGFGTISVEYTVRLGDLAERLREFRRGRETLALPPVQSPFDKKLYSTYLSYLPENGFCYPLEMKRDERGYFCEALKSEGFGQISVSHTKPGIVRGNHWHHTKVEKFLVVEGNAVIRFRKIGGTETLEYEVSGKRLELVDVPVGYTHAIENTGDTNLITVIWCNELFDPERPDVYFEEV